MAAHLLINTLLALLLASASIVYAFEWFFSYNLFFASAICSLPLPWRRQCTFFVENLKFKWALDLYKN